MTFHRHNSLNPFICLVSLLWLIVLISSSPLLTTPVIGIEVTPPYNTDIELLQQASLERAASSSSANNSSNVYRNIPNAESIYNSESRACQQQLGPF